MHVDGWSQGVVNEAIYIYIYIYIYTRNDLIVNVILAFRMKDSSHDS